MQMTHQKYCLYLDFFSLKRKLSFHSYLLLTFWWHVCVSSSLSLSFHTFTLSLSFLSGYFISLLLPTSHSPASPGAFILAGCFLYENTPIGRQAPMSDTIHCTCIDMKSVLTSTTEFCVVVETAYQWQCRSCDQIKEAVKLCWCPCKTLKFTAGARR